jgi:hypothetical protein
MATDVSGISVGATLVAILAVGTSRASESHEDTGMMIVSWVTGAWFARGSHDTPSSGTRGGTLGVTRRSTPTIMMSAAHALAHHESHA